MLVIHGVHVAPVMLALLSFGAVCRAGDSIEPSLYDPPDCCEVARAGHPWRCFPWADSQHEQNYVGYYVGGGKKAWRRSTRCPVDGTWGWDYSGVKIPRLVELGWWHGRRRQGGTGQYDPDGPRVAEAISHHLDRE